MSHILGVDYNTKALDLCALPLLGGGKPAVWTIDFRPHKVDAFGAISNMRSAVDQWFHRVPEDIMPRISVIWIEHAHGQGPVDFKLGRVQGAAMLALAEFLVPDVINEVGPPEWKKGLGLPGNAKKADYQGALREMAAPLGRIMTADQLDAWAIAEYGRRENERGV